MNDGDNVIFELGKIAVDGYYDYQQIRIDEFYNQHNNRGVKS